MRRSTRTNTRSVPDRRTTSPVTMLPTASAPPALRCRSNCGAWRRAAGKCEGRACDGLQQGGGAALPCRLALRSGGHWTCPRQHRTHCPLHTRERRLQDGAGRTTHCFSMYTNTRTRIHTRTRTHPAPSTHPVELGQRVPSFADGHGRARELLLRVHVARRGVEGGQAAQERALLALQVTVGTRAGVGQGVGEGLGERAPCRCSAHAHRMLERPRLAG